MRLWNPKTAKGFDSINAFESPVYSAALSPDNKYVLAANGAPLLDKKGQHVVKNGVAIYQDSMVSPFRSGQ